MRSRVIVELENKRQAEIIDGYGDVTVRASEENATVCEVEFSFAVAHGLNQIYLTAAYYPDLKEGGAKDMEVSGFPTSSDIYLEVEGRKVAVVQSYMAKASKTSQSVEAFGESEPVAILPGRLSTA